MHEVSYIGKRLPRLRYLLMLNTRGGGHASPAKWSCTLVWSAEPQAFYIVFGKARNIGGPCFLLAKSCVKGCTVCTLHQRARHSAEEACLGCFPFATANLPLCFHAVCTRCEQSMACYTQASTHYMKNETVSTQTAAFAVTRTCHNKNPRPVPVFFPCYNFFVDEHGLLTLCLHLIASFNILHASIHLIHYIQY